jgi:hypothetical protein
MQQLHHGGVIAAGVLDWEGPPGLRSRHSQEGVATLLEAISRQGKVLATAVEELTRAKKTSERQKEQAGEDWPVPQESDAHHGLQK